MKKIICVLFVLSIFACKKEESKVVQIQHTDSTVYYSKWTVMNKTPYNIFDHVNDLSFQSNKSMAFISGQNLLFIDSNFNLKTSQIFTSNTPNVYRKFQNHNSLLGETNRFFFFLKPVSKTKESSQLIIENNVNSTEINTRIYNRSYFINDSNTSSFYSYLGYGYDYFAYYIYDTIPTSYKHQLNYYNHQKQINNTVIFFSNIIFDEAFKLNDQVVFWKHTDNEYVTVNTNSMEVQTKLSILKDFSLIGTFNNYAYFYNYKADVVFKTNDFKEFKVVYQNEMLYMPLSYSDGKCLLIIKNKSVSDTYNMEFLVLNLETNETHILSIPFESSEAIKCNWVIGNTLYVLTTNNIYARKF